MKQSKIAIPGGGNIGTSLAKGLVASKQFTRREILITEKRESRIAYLKSLGFRVADNNHEAVSQGGIEIGFDSEMSQLIAAQTVKGASGLILETRNHPEREIDRVTTPQGITISGLNEMEHQGMSSAIIRGLITSYNKLENLALKSQKSSPE